jgi:hypothetical protein
VPPECYELPLRSGIPAASMAGAVPSTSDTAQSQSVASKPAPASGTSAPMVIDWAPAFEAVLQAAAAALARMSPALQRLEEQIAGSSAKLGLTAARREQLTELWCEKDMLADQIKRLQAKQHAALTQFEAARAVDLGVEEAVHVGVTLVAEEQAAVLNQTLEGPLWIGWDERRQLVVKPKGGDYPVPIARYAQLRASPRAAPPTAAAA